MPMAPSGLQTACPVGGVEPRLAGLTWRGARLAGLADFGRQFVVHEALVAADGGGVAVGLRV